MVENHFQLNYCNYEWSNADILHVQAAIDIAIDKCTFWNNCWRSIHLSNDRLSLRTSNSLFISHNAIIQFSYAIMFDATETMTKMTDYMTYNTFFQHGNTTLNTSLTQNFTAEALNERIVAIYHPGTSYYVSQEETLYASGIVNYQQHYFMYLEQEMFSSLVW